MRIDTETIKQMDSFNYLGSTVTFDGRYEKKIRMQILLAKNTFGKIKNLVTITKLSIRMKRRFMKCFVWSVLLYVCETWMMRRADAQRLQAAEKWFWRRMLTAADREENK